MGTATLFSFNGVLYKDLTTTTSAGNLSVYGGTYTQGTTMAQVLGLAPAKGVQAGANDTSNVFVTNGTMNYTAFGGTSTDESKGFQNMIKLVQNAIFQNANKDEMEPSWEIALMALERRLAMESCCMLCGLCCGKRGILLVSVSVWSGE